jgi:hypothetical protein
MSTISIIGIVAAICFIMLMLVLIEIIRRIDIAADKVTKLIEDSYSKYNNSQHITDIALIKEHIKIISDILYDDILPEIRKKNGKETHDGRKDK